MYIWVILFCLLGAVVDPMNKAAVRFLISDVLKRGLTKHKKETETRVNPEEDQSIEDHDESLNFDR